VAITLYNQMTFSKVYVQPIVDSFHSVKL